MWSPYLLIRKTPPVCDLLRLFFCFFEDLKNIFYFCHNSKEHFVYLIEMSTQNLANLSDEELMALYKKGIEGAFECLYLRHKGKVYGYLRSKVQNEDLAADIFQEVFIKVHRSKHLYNEDFGFLPWVFTITRNLMIDELRKRAKHKSVALEEAAEIPTQETVPETSLTDLGGLLQQIPETQRKAIELRYLENKTFEEISKTLETSETNARKLVSRGVHRIKLLFKEGGSHD